MKSLLVKFESYNQEALTVIHVTVTGATFNPISDHGKSFLTNVSDNFPAS
jgi:hypothetical protein